MELKKLKSKGVTVCLAEKEYLLRYDLNAFAYMEEKLGKNFLEADLSKLRILKHVIRAGLLCNFDNEKSYERDDYNNLKPTLSEIGKMIDMETLMSLPEQIDKAIRMALPDEDEGEGEKSRGEQKKK